jgi:hypothetical protein
MATRGEDSPNVVPHSDLIARGWRAIGAPMNSSVCMLLDNTMIRFGWGVEDIAR